MKNDNWTLDVFKNLFSNKKYWKYTAKNSYRIKNKKYYNAECALWLYASNTYLIRFFYELKTNKVFVSVRTDDNTDQYWHELKSYSSKEIEEYDQIAKACEKLEKAIRILPPISEWDREFCFYCSR